MLRRLPAPNEHTTFSFYRTRLGCVPCLLRVWRKCGRQLCVQKYALLESQSEAARLAQRLWGKMCMECRCDVRTRACSRALVAVETVITAEREGNAQKLTEIACWDIESCAAASPLRLKNPPTPCSESTPRSTTPTAHPL